MEMEKQLCFCCVIISAGSVNWSNLIESHTVSVSICEASDQTWNSQRQVHSRDVDVCPEVHAPVHLFLVSRTRNRLRILNMTDTHSTKSRDNKMWTQVPVLRHIYSSESCLHMEGLQLQRVTDTHRASVVRHARRSLRRRDRGARGHVCRLQLQILTDTHNVRYSPSEIYGVLVGLIQVIVLTYTRGSLGSLDVHVVGLGPNSTSQIPTHAHSGRSLRAFVAMSVWVLSSSSCASTSYL